MHMLLDHQEIHLAELYYPLKHDTITSQTIGDQFIMKLGPLSAMKIKELLEQILERLNQIEANQNKKKVVQEVKTDASN